MIKANDKDAKNAFFQSKAVNCAYFRGRQIWKHNHIWQNSICSICGEECTHGYDSTASDPYLSKSTNEDGICSDCGHQHIHEWDTLIGRCNKCHFCCMHNDGSTAETCAICGIVKATRIILLPATGNTAYTIEINGTQYNVTSENVIVTAQEGNNLFQFIPEAAFAIKGRHILNILSTGTGGKPKLCQVSISKNMTITLKPS